jgi:hypothetical protein
LGGFFYGKNGFMVEIYNNGFCNIKIVILAEQITSIFIAQSQPIGGEFVWFYYTYKQVGGNYRKP